jgi:hypothetical protein
MGNTMLEPAVCLCLGHSRMASAARQLARVIVENRSCSNLGRGWWTDPGGSHVLMAAVERSQRRRPWVVLSVLQWARKDGDITCADCRKSTSSWHHCMVGTGCNSSPSADVHFGSCPQKPPFYSLWRHLSVPRASGQHLFSSHALHVTCDKGR